MINRFLNLEMEFLATLNVCNFASGFSGIGGSLASLTRFAENVASRLALSLYGGRGWTVAGQLNR